MRFYTTMPCSLKPYYIHELAEAKKTFATKQYQLCWRYLERAHILGQPYPWQHTAVHWRMLVFGIRLKNTKEIIGQLPRLMVGGVKSFVGKIPVGNTGGANVPALKPMEIPDDLKKIMEERDKS